MIPDFRIVADSVEITSVIRDRFLELQVTDEAGIESDMVRITLDDRRRDTGAIAELPRVGTCLEISLGYKETNLIHMGSYVVDEIEISFPPATLIVSGKAANMATSFRSPKTRSWDGTTIGAIVTTIALEHGYEPAMDPVLASKPIPHLDQTEESDMSFLTRLAGQHDAVAKPAAGRLAFALRGQAKSVSGKTLPVISLTESEVSRWSYQHSARKAEGSGKQKGNVPRSSGGTKTYWWDFEKGERQEVTVGDAPYSTIRFVHASEQEALDAAKSRKNTGDRGQSELSLSLSGNPRIAAECKLAIDFRPGIPAVWIIKSVKHQLGASGFITSIEAELPLEE
jgi:hypothetical protein